MEEGTLTKELDIQLSDTPGTVATTADGGFIFVCLRSAKLLWS